MHYIYLELIRRFGLGKDFVCVPVRSRHWAYAFDVDCEHILSQSVVLLPVGVMRFPRSGTLLKVWAGECMGCDRVYFGLASQRVGLPVFDGGVAY